MELRGTTLTLRADLNLETEVKTDALELDGSLALIGWSY